MRLQVGIDPLTVFSISDMDQLRKIRRHHWKERVKISKIAKFESDLLKTKEDTALKSRENLQTFVRWGRRLAPTVQKSVNFSLGGGTWVSLCWVCVAGLSEPLPHYSLFCGQL